MSPVAGPMASEVARALKAAHTKPEDAGAVALANRYARLLDEAQALADEAALVELDERDFDARRRLERVEKLVAGHAATSDLGPKLLAALTALGATPAGRKAVPAGGGKADAPNPAADELAKLRAQRGAASRAN